MGLKTESFSPVSAFPNQAVQDYTENDYMQTLRFIASQWNIRNTSFVSTPITNAGPNNVNGAYSDQQLGFARKYIQNVQYIYGNQVASQYGFFVQDLKGEAIQVPMFRGMDITKYFTTIDGEFRDMIEYLPKMITISGYSENVIAKKKITQDAIKAKAENLTFFTIAQEAAGFQFNPIDADFSDEYALQKKVENFQEGMEIAYQQIAVDTTYRNHYKTILAKACNYTFIGGMAMMDVYFHNGRVHWDLVPPHQAIFDSSKNDDQHKDDEYGGRVFEVSVAEALNRWKWSDEEEKDIKAIADNANNWTVYNTYTNLNGLAWWQVFNGVPKICCVKGVWQSLEYRDGEWVKVNRQGTIIANKYIRDEKVCDTQVYNKHDRGRTQMGMIVVTPNSLLGSVVSIVDMVKRFQDLKDAFTSKMIDLIASSIGKSYFVRANMLPEGMRTPELLSQLKQAHVVVLEGADIDEEDSDKLQKLIEPIDLTLDPGISSLLAIIQYYDGVIADILNIPPSARGQMSQYLPKDVVNSNIQQSNKGLKWFYGSLFMWIERILEYSCDLAKIMMPESQEGMDYLSMIVGDAMVDLLSMDTLKEMQFEDFLMKLEPANALTEADMAELRSLALQTAATGNMNSIMLSYIKMKKATNLTQLENYFEEEAYKARIREDQQKQMEMQAQQQSAQIASETARQGFEMQSQTKLQDTQIKEEGANTREAMKVAATVERPGS